MKENDVNNNLQSNKRFLCGLEIHQRLKTSKLFCRCNSNGYDISDKKFYRQMHIVRSELGEIDRAAKLEIERGLAYRYYLASNSCLVELDEEPPLEINKEALKFALIAAKAFHCKVFDNLFVMRKTVLDGSNTSGFQRTILIGIDGYIETSKGKVKIQTICLEEESCGILGTNFDEQNNSNNEFKDYSLSRLGIPLLEIATEPSAKDFEHVKEIAEIIGLTLRVLGIAERGIGTIRQDLNISIPNSARCELKGVQDLDSIPKIVELEVLRQERFKQFLESNEFKINEEIIDLTEFLLTQKSLKEWIKDLLVKGKKALSFIVKNSKGKFSYEILPNFRFGTELSFHAKSNEVKGIIHSDEDLAKYGINKDELFKYLKLQENDGFILVIASEKAATESLERIKHRLKCRELLPETRRVNYKNFYSEYMRPLPGQQRMYPETDLPVLEITEEFINSLLKDAKIYSYNDFVAMLANELNDNDLANRLVRSKLLDVYIDLSNTLSDSKEKRIQLARYLINVLPSFSSKYEIDQSKALHITREILTLLFDNKITRSALPETTEMYLQTNSVERVLQNYSRIADKEVLNKLLAENGNDISKVMKTYGKRIEINDLRELVTNNQKNS